MHSASPPPPPPPDDGESDVPMPPRRPRAPAANYERAHVDETFTDAANGQTFAFDHAGHLRYVADVQKWIIWNGQRWVDAVDGDVLRAAKETSASLFAAAVKVKDEERRKKAVAWAIASLNVRRCKAMIEMGQSEDDIELRVVELDADPMLLNVSNGTVTLKNGMLRTHDRADFITRLVPIAYDLEARCPRWLQFLSEVFGGDEELISFVQRAIGYSLTGDIREHALFLLWGSGCNGKSVFVEVLRALLGDFGVASPMATFTAKRDNGGPTNDLAMLRGARLVTVQESEQSARFSEATVKSLTGGDAITARFLNREFFTYMPQFKPWIATNHKPKVKGTDDGFWRRVRLIPFVVSFLGREDKTLGAELHKEMPGILNWALDGCIEWQLKGLGTAAAVSLATQSYREESDMIAAFITDCLVVHPDASIPSKQLYKIYAEWAEENGEQPIKQKTLTSSLLARPGIAAYRSNSERGLSGIGEKTDE